MDCSLPGSSVRGISQVRILQWGAVFSSTDLPIPGIKPGSLHCRLILYCLSHQESLPGGGAGVQTQTHLRGHGNSTIARLGPGRSSGVRSAAQRAGPSFPLPLPAAPASVTSDCDALSPRVPLLASGWFHSKAVSFPTFLGGSLGGEDLREEGMATHSSILAWRMPWTEEPGGHSPCCCKESERTEHRETLSGYKYFDVVLSIFRVFMMPVLWVMCSFIYSFSF